MSSWCLEASERVGCFGRRFVCCYLICFTTNTIHVRDRASRPLRLCVTTSHGRFPWAAEAPSRAAAKPKSAPQPLPPIDTRPREQHRATFDNPPLQIPQMSLVPEHERVQYLESRVQATESSTRALLSQALRIQSDIDQAYQGEQSRTQAPC